MYKQSRVGKEGTHLTGLLMWRHKRMEKAWYRMTHPGNIDYNSWHEPWQTYSLSPFKITKVRQGLTKYFTFFIFNIQITSLLVHFVFWMPDIILSHVRPVTIQASRKYKLPTPKFWLCCRMPSLSLFRMLNHSFEYSHLNSLLSSCNTGKLALLDPTLPSMTGGYGIALLTVILVFYLKYN